MDLKTFNPNGVGVDNGAYYGLPFTPEEAALVLVSAPWDVTVSYGAGTALAPDALIEASTQLDLTMLRRREPGSEASLRPTSTIRCRRSPASCGPMPNG